MLIPLSPVRLLHTLSLIQGEHAPTLGRSCEHASLLVPDETLPRIRLQRVFEAAQLTGAGG